MSFTLRPWRRFYPTQNSKLPQLPSISLKMKLLAFVFTLALPLVASAKPPEIGDVLSKDAKPAKDNMHIMVDSAQIWPAYELIRDKISYTVGVDGHQTIAYISPHDSPLFKTPEGVTVGSPLSSVTAITKSPPIKRSGWAYYISLPSGWNAAFVTASSQGPTADPLPTSAKVSFLFKSSWAQQPKHK